MGGVFIISRLVEDRWRERFFVGRKFIPKDLNGKCHSYPAEKQELSWVVFSGQDCLTWMAGLCDLSARIV